MNFQFGQDGQPLSLDQSYKDRLSVMFLAKHALSDGQFDNEDGSHAVYHGQILSILRDHLGLNVVPANSYDAVLEKPPADYLFNLYNRGGFRNSEVLAPTLAEFHNVPHLGCSPSIRGFVDDKHLTKFMFEALEVATPRWVRYAPSDRVNERPELGPRLIAKPNNSSASWGISVEPDWAKMAEHIRWLQAQNHDVIVEEMIPGYDMTVPVIGADRAWMLPATKLVTSSPDSVPTYEEKRGFKGGYECAIVPEAFDIPDIPRYTEIITKAIWPFDYGRVDYRIHGETGQVYAIEINVCGNLGEEKSVAQGAFDAGLSHAELVESILAFSLARQGVRF